MSEKESHAEEIILMENEDGETFELQIIDRLVVDSIRYAVVRDLSDEEEDDEDYSVMIYRLQKNDEGGESFLPIEDEDELDNVFDYFRISNEDYEFGDAE